MEQDSSIRWSLKDPLEQFWCFEIKATREEIWGYISDTSRFNREIGLAPRKHIEKDGKVYVTTTMIKLKQEWIEEPWQWLAGKTICSTRLYLRGMAKRAQAVFHIAEEGNKVFVYIYFGWNPANFLWGIFLRATSPYVRNLFRKAFVKIEQQIKSEKKLENAFVVLAAPLEEPQRKHLAEIREKLLAQGLTKSSVNLLCEYIRGGDDMELESIRLVPLSKKWGADLRDLTVIALHATRLGLLNISWKVICPHCRGARVSASTLGDIPVSAECTICDIKFSSSDADSIEIVFHVHPSIRVVKEQLYCSAEPSKKSHIKVQQLLNKGEAFSANLKLKDGFYRLRLGSKKWQLEVNHRFLQCDLKLSEKLEKIELGNQASIRFENSAEEQQFFIVEDLWWQNDALKPAQILSLWEFRDIFSAEHLNTNVKLYLGEQVILFTDIVGSTAFYEKFGDAKAFSQVRSHFQEVFTEVNKNRGVIVKTVGDAVMASFTAMEDALNAAVEIQKKFHSARLDTPIRLRISIHSGVVIAVQLNTGIDYFGATVNVASKIQACAQGGEIALSEKVFEYAHKAQISHLKSFASEKRKNSRELEASRDIYVLQINENFPVKKSRIA